MASCPEEKKMEGQGRHCDCESLIRRTVQQRGVQDVLSPKAYLTPTTMSLENKVGGCRLSPRGEESDGTGDNANVLMPKTSAAQESNITNNHARLDFAKVKHCGRSTELKRLNATFHDCCISQEPEAASVIVQAVSGLGKTALIEAFVEQVRDPRILICRGKFEEATAASEPFAAIISATSDLLKALSESEERILWAQLIKEALSSDKYFMAEIIPALGELLFGEHGSRLQSSNSIDNFTLDGFGDMTDKEWRFERFRLGLRSLFRCVSTRRPVLFLLDDMQWAEQDSVTVVWTIMEDMFPKRRLMIVGASRPTQENSHLSLMTEQLQSKLLSFMTLDSLRVMDVSNILAGLFTTSIEEVDSLANIVHMKSNGNPFVILQFLRISEQQGHIYFSGVENKWFWDETSIIAHASIADTVRDVVADKLLSVDHERKAALITAACFGTSHFEVDTVVHAMMLMDENSQGVSLEVLDDQAVDYDQVDPFVVRQNVRKLKATLESAAKDGLVTKLSDGHFRFSHDRIREAAYSLLPEGIPRTKLHLKIGRQLRSWMETHSELCGVGLSEESLLLNATNQLNLGASLITDDWERLDLAELNYQAAEFSAKKSSFVPSMEFLKRGILQLGKNRWSMHYNLTLKLTVALTRIQFCCGMYDTCLETASQVIANGRTFSDKKPVYHTQLLTLLQEERQADATSIALNILDVLGHRLTRKFVLVKAYTHHTALDKRLRGLSTAELMNLPDLVDPGGKIEDMLGFLNRLGEISFFGGDDSYVLHCINRVIQVTLDHGRNSMTAYGFFAWAWMKSSTGQLEEAKRIADVANYYATERKWRTRDMRTELHFIAIFKMYKSPWPEIVDPLYEAIKKLQSEGAMEIVLMDSHVYYRFCLMSGMPLSSVLQRCAEYNEMLLDYRHPIFWHLNAPLTQALLNLTGHSEKPTVLKGEHMDEGHHVALWERNGNKKAVAQYRFFKMMLGVFFREYEATLDMVALMPALMSEGLDVLVPCRLFYTGLSLIFVSKEKRFKRNARRREVCKIVKKLNDWAAAGMSSCKHMELILRAQLLAVSQGADLDVIQNYFQTAINAAKLSGVIQHEALANELAGSWLCERSCKEESYAQFLSKAATLYEAWGASVKVDDIMGRFPQCFGDQPTFHYKCSRSSRTAPMTGSFSSSMWSTSLYNKGLKEAPREHCIDRNI